MDTLLWIFAIVFAVICILSFVIVLATIIVAASGGEVHIGYDPNDDEELL